MGKIEVNTLTVVFKMSVVFLMSACSNMRGVSTDKIEKSAVQEQSYFDLSLNYFTHRKDTLTIQFVVTNRDSAMAHLLYKGYLYQTFNILDDTSLVVERKVLHASVNTDEISTLSKGFENCEEKLAASKDFLWLRPMESYTFNVTQVVNGLNKKPRGYVLKVEGSLYIHDDISVFCPKVWTGKLNATRQLTLL